MPVVEIRALPQRDGIDIGAVLTAVTTALAAVLNEEPSGTWATWEEIASARYAEGSDTPLSQPRDTHPPLVRVTAFEGRSPELVAAMLDTVAGTLTRELDLDPGNAFVRYDEARSGRLFTGGEVRG